jgi:hypothetical protein
MRMTQGLQIAPIIGATTTTGHTMVNISAGLTTAGEFTNRIGFQVGVTDDTPRSTVATLGTGASLGVIPTPLLLW